MIEYSQAYGRPADIEAKITFVATAEGGRASPARSGYRADHNFGLATLSVAAHEYVSTSSVKPGTSALAHLWFLDPVAQTRRLHPGFEFTVQEGPRIVGHGSIIAVLNVKLKRDQSA